MGSARSAEENSAVLNFPGGYPGEIQDSFSGWTLLNNLSVPDRGCKSKIEPNIVIPMTRRMSLFVGVVPVFAIPTPEAID
jgi:hypothetical protein